MMWDGRGLMGMGNNNTNTNTYDHFHIHSTNGIGGSYGVPSTNHNSLGINGSHGSANQHGWVGNPHGWTNPHGVNDGSNGLLAVGRSSSQMISNIVETNSACSIAP